MSAAREHLVLSLDVASAAEARALAEPLSPHFAVAKVGLELFGAEGPAVVRMLQGLGYEVFADLKFHDIPTTVERAARAVGRLGVRYLDVHAAGGRAMVAAAVEGLRAGNDDAGRSDAVLLAVTVLTSDADTSAFDERVGVAAAAGAGGVVCSAHEVESVGERFPGLVTVVPGTRPAGAQRHDQVRTATPEQAIAAGADLLVVGRVVRDAADREAAAAAVAGGVERGLRTRSRPG